MALCWDLVLRLQLRLCLRLRLPLRMRLDISLNRLGMSHLSLSLGLGLSCLSLGGLCLGCLCLGLCMHRSRLCLRMRLYLSMRMRRPCLRNHVVMMPQSGRSRLWSLRRRRGPWRLVRWLPFEWCSCGRCGCRLLRRRRHLGFTDSLWALQHPELRGLWLGRLRWSRRRNHNSLGMLKDRGADGAVGRAGRLVSDIRRCGLAKLARRRNACFCQQRSRGRRIASHGRVLRSGNRGWASRGHVAAVHGRWLRL